MTLLELNLWKHYLKSENPDVVNFGGGNTEDINKVFDYNSYEDCLLEDYYKAINKESTVC